MEENKQIGGQQRNDTSKKSQREEDHLATFLKYLDDLYKEATELCTLCGAEVAIVLSLPSGELYTFGYPNFEMVVDRFLNLDPKQPIGGIGDPVEDADANIGELSPEDTQKLKAWLLEVKDKIREHRAKLAANAPPTVAVAGDDAGSGSSSGYAGAGSLGHGLGGMP
ncbi:agamous-like MADS-box protein AGL62 [Diospyros lotus]|uniref:agamous-like MADS-box protein AGL62 n=1 Tax=Diospyros lotus TaxID=55363 RepID=UPI0022574715|nr:agamous-like MADS-box protein AGL62 [Diospyros lotus]